MWDSNDYSYKLQGLLLDWEGQGKHEVGSGRKNPAFFACYFDAIQREKLLNFDAIFGPYLNEPFFFLS